jgi:hypothetical protein
MTFNLSRNCGVDGMKITAAAIWFFAFAMPVCAQFEPLQFAICKKISAEADRLKCFDGIGKPTSETVPAKPDEPAKWSYHESKSPIDDSPQITAALDSSPRGAAIVMRCQENKTEFAFLTGTIFFAETGHTAPRSSHNDVGHFNR